MFELWARKRMIDGRGQRYEFITSFEDEIQQFYMIDQLDKITYQEAMIIKNQQCVFYKEFEKPYIRNLRKK